jgi:hypothetical protein
MVHRIRWNMGRLLLGLLALSCVACAGQATVTTTPTASVTAIPLAPLAGCAPGGRLCAPTIVLVNTAGQMRLADRLPDQPQPATSFPLGLPQPDAEIFINGNPINLLVTLANPTNVAETVQAVELRLVHFTPQHQTIFDAFAACDTRTFTVTRGVQENGTCHLGDDPTATYGYPVALAGKLADGSIIPLQLALTTEGQQATGPVILAPYAYAGATALLDIAIAPQRAGTYQFQVGVMVLGDQLRFFDPIISALAVTPDQVVRYWSADNCTLPGVSNQVPATGAYLCPGPVPTGS